VSPGDFAQSWRRLAARRRGHAWGSGDSSGGPDGFDHRDRRDPLGPRRPSRGLVYLGMSSTRGKRTCRKVLPGRSREGVAARSVTGALWVLYRHLQGLPLDDVLPEEMRRREAVGA